MNKWKCSERCSLFWKNSFYTQLCWMQVTKLHSSSALQYGDLNSSTHTVRTLRFYGWKNARACADDSRQRCGHLQAIRSECDPDDEDSDADSSVCKFANGIWAGLLSLEEVPVSSRYLLGVFLTSHWHLTGFRPGLFSMPSCFLRLLYRLSGL